MSLPFYFDALLLPYSTLFYHIQTTYRYLGIYQPTNAPGWSSTEPTQDLVAEYEMKDGSKYSSNNPIADPKDLNNNRDPRLDQTMFVHVYINKRAFLF